MNEVVTGFVAVIIAYLLGSINSAYIVTRLVTGEDIRKLGGGNAGGRNVFREVGLGAAIPVAIFDIGKGAASVAIAHWLLDVPLYEPHHFVLLAGIAAVAGHMWSIYLKFTGGNGLAATIGVLAMTMPWALLVILVIMSVLTSITRNPVLSLNIGLLSIPLSAWLLEHSGLLAAFSGTLIIIMVLNFLPVARAALVRAGGKETLFAELVHRKSNDERS
jgi:glycerol-3-phosphate acyltransferase PlsY